MEKDFVSVSFELIDMKHEKMINVYGRHLELHPTYLEYYIHFVAEIPKDKEDEGLGTKDAESLRLFFAERQSVTATTLDLTIYDQWQITIYVAGSTDDVYLYYDYSSFKDAKLAYTQINEWIKNKHL